MLNTVNKGRNLLHFFGKGTLLCATALLAAVMFLFSAQGGQESAGLSSRISVWIAAMFDKLGTLQLSAGELDQFAHWIAIPVRKLGHLSEYALLALLLFVDAGVFIKDLGQKRWKRFAAAFLCTLLFAVSDEIHQLFIPGRDGNLRDILIDMTGAFGGLIVGNFVYDLVLDWNNYRRRRKENNE